MEGLSLYRRVTKIFYQTRKFMNVVDRRLQLMFFKEYIANINSILDAHWDKFDVGLKFEKVYKPLPISKLLKRQNIRKLQNAVDIVSDSIFNKTEFTNNQIFAVYILMVWHLILKELYYPVLFLIFNQELVIEDYKQLGFNKTDLNKIVEVMDIIDIDFESFVNMNTVGDNDIDKIEGYLKRLMRMTLADKNRYQYNDKSN